MEIVLKRCDLIHLALTPSRVYIYFDKSVVCAMVWYGMVCNGVVLCGVYNEQHHSHIHTFALWIVKSQKTLPLNAYASFIVTHYK